MAKAPEIPVHNRRDGLEPLPELRRMSQETPLLETPRDWVATGQAEVRQILGDADRFSTMPPADTEEDRRRQIQEGNLLQYDPPDHTRLRRMLTPEFTNRRMRRLEPFIEEIVAERLDALERAGRPADFMRHFAWPIPGLVSCALLGVPRDDQAELARNLDISRAGNRSRKQQMTAGKAYVGYMSQLVARKRRDPGDDLLGMLIREHGDDVSDSELTGIGTSLMAAGYENVAGTLGLGTMLLLGHPDQLALLLEKPELTDRAVEELLRYVSVIATSSPRTALADVPVGDAVIKEGDVVVCSLLAVNRAAGDGTGHDGFDITRDVTPHLAFGHGIHYCLGAPLTRVQLRIALPRLLHRFPGLRLAVPPEELRYRTHAPNYGVEALPVTW